MRLLKTYDFNGITGFKLGWSLIGPPLMTVFFYVMDDLMVDTGQAHMRKEVLGIAEDKGIQRIALTHHHEDHSGNAAAVQKKTGAGVFGHALTCEKMAVPYKILPYQSYVWGKTEPLSVTVFPDDMETAWGPLVPVPTPGHAKDHTAFWLKDRGILFSGDLYLADRIKFFRSDEDMGTQIDSLKKVTKLSFDTLLCSHYPKLEQGRERIMEKLAFLEDLYGNIIDLWEKGMPEKEIFKALNLREDYFTKYFCFGNVSMMNGVRSAVRHHEQQKTLL